METEVADCHGDVVEVEVTRTDGLVEVSDRGHACDHLWGFGVDVLEDGEARRRFLSILDARGLVFEGGVVLYRGADEADGIRRVVEAVVEAMRMSPCE